MTAPFRRRDPQPIARGWELAVAAAGGALIAVALAALVGLGLASALWGGGWVWPQGTETITDVLGGLLNGDPGRGLSPDQLGRVAGPVPVYACVAAAELVLLTAAVITAVLLARHRRPGDARGGMATHREAEQALGLRQLRAGRAVIRPDRYPSKGCRGRLHRLIPQAATRSAVVSTDPSTAPLPDRPPHHRRSRHHPSAL
ncbi:conjugal transfer protein [Blastococcus sp. CT_GayMR16]|uniref:conjugal transfer protein n=1 Tax=Blastococcus sp. CT_GayMR16 TaxID=2559607 RepID=UPI001ADDE381|nr:conjugal transfer protein [Blastococcus sp. CT_GayMR16]